LCTRAHLAFTVQVKPCLPSCANRQRMFENCLLVKHDICPRAQSTSMGRLLSVLLFISIILISSNSLRLDPCRGALLVIIFKWNVIALCLFQNPGINMLARQGRPALHVVVGKVLHEHRFRNLQTINQTGTAYKLATGLGLSKVDPATSCSRTRTNIPFLLARQNQIKPLLLHNQRVLC
jgi:hypothetical protein